MTVQNSGPRLTATISLATVSPSRIPGFETSRDNAGQAVINVHFDPHLRVREKKGRELGRRTILTVGEGGYQNRA